ncbi:MAG: sugar phosphate nucleotidyltransferase [Oscillospiraceae bacterium]|nr:sugar phosphate nucleotidyltransferase [Oscillospiraceae bacterium]
MKAVIMAGGEGSRLRPLTCDIPKPMTRLLGRPVLEYILDLLKSHSVMGASVTLRYLPDRITGHFPDGEYKGIRLDFIEENEPLGTAGSVRGACGENDDEILVISGDAMCDFDLSAALRFHREHSADVTIAAKRVDDPREYGLIDADKSGDIRAFIEKPAFSQAVSNLANTGIYILSNKALMLIPTDKPYDFAKDLFPLMLKSGMNLMCWESTGYWCDIGDLESYIGCQQDMLDGLVNCEIHGTVEDGSIFADKTRPANCIIDPPVYIGKNVVIENGACIEMGSIIDDGCYIGKNARVTASVLLEKSYISRGAKLTGALVCSGAVIKPSAMLFEGTAVGAGAVIGEKAIINAGVKIWNKKTVDAGTTVIDHVKTGAVKREFFDDDGITGQIGVELTPEFMARVGAAVGSLMPGKSVALGYSSNRGSEVLASALSSGIRGAGTTVMNFGGNFMAQFEFFMNFCSLPLGVFVKGDSRASLRLMGFGGVPASRALEREAEMILSRGEFTRRGWDAMGDSVDMSGISAMYRSELLRFAPKGLSGLSVQIKCGNLAAKKILGDVLFTLGCATDGGFTIEMSSQGDKVRIFDEREGYIPHYKIFVCCAIFAMESGDVAVPFDAPRILDEYAKNKGVKLLRYLSCPADNSDEDARKLARTQMWSRDGLMQSIMFLSLVKKAGGLSVLLRTLPEFDREVRTIDTNCNPAGLIMGMSTDRSRKKSSGIGEGILLGGGSKIVLIKPLKRGTGIKIMAEARSQEIASELCDDIEKYLKKNIQEPVQ